MDPVFKKVVDIQTFLKFTFGIVPMVAGLDKFTNVLTNWPDYLNPMVTNVLPISATAFMMIVGVIEIAAGVLVLVKTKLGSFVVCAWLILIALSLIISGRYLDVAVRDLVMAGGALTLFMLTEVVTHPKGQQV